MMKKINLIIFGVIILIGFMYFVFLQFKEKNSLIAKEEKINRISEDTWKCLNQSRNMVLYSLEPYSRDMEFAKKDVVFHEFKVLGSLWIENQDLQTKIANEIKRAVSEVDKDFANCFWPRHGVRVSDEKSVYDFLICYQCNTLYLFKDEGKKREIVIGGTVNFLNEILINAKVPLPAQ